MAISGLLLAVLGPLQIVGIAVTGICFTVLVLFFLLREDKSFQASDGTMFSSEEACNAYEVVLQRLMNLYKINGSDSVKTETYGLQPSFIKLLRDEGFPELKILLRYKKDFQILLDLLNEEKA